MKNYYDLFDQCLQNQGTNVTYCSKILNDIVPVKQFGMNSLREITNISITSNLNESEFSNLKIVNNIASFTNDDAKYYLNSLLEILHDASYLEEYSVTLSEANDSLVAIMKASNNEKKTEIYELFGELPKSFNSRVLAYLS